MSRLPSHELWAEHRRAVFQVDINGSCFTGFQRRKMRKLILKNDNNMVFMFSQTYINNI